MVYQAFRQMRGKENGADWKTIWFGRFGGFEGGLELVSTWLIEEELAGENWQQTWRRRLKLWICPWIQNKGFCWECVCPNYPINLCYFTNGEFQTTCSDLGQNCAQSVSSPNPPIPHLLSKWVQFIKRKKNILERVKEMWKFHALISFVVWSQKERHLFIGGKKGNIFGNAEF